MSFWLFRNRENSQIAPSAFNVRCHFLYGKVPHGTRCLLSDLKVTFLRKMILGYLLVWMVYKIWSFDDVNWQYITNCNGLSELSHWVGLWSRSLIALLSWFFDHFGTSFVIDSYSGFMFYLWAMLIFVNVFAGFLVGSRALSKFHVGIHIKTIHLATQFS